MIKHVLLGSAVIGMSACSHFQAVETAESPQPQAPLKSGVVHAHFDDSVQPQEDFYRWVNGTWLEETEIPADRSNYGAFSVLDERAEQQLRTIIETAAATNAEPGSDTQKIGDFYTSFMDVETINALGAKPLTEEFGRIDALTSTDELPTLMAHHQLVNIGGIYGAYIWQDAKQSDQYTVYFVQSGTGLPDRDYYLEDTEDFARIRKAYRAHIEKMLNLAGIEDAATKAEAIFDLETELARVQWTKVDSRDISKTYNKVTVEELAELTPNFDWATFLAEMGIELDAVVVAQPSFFEASSDLIAETDLATWQAYLKWQVIDDYAPYLSQEFVQGDFDFYGKTLRGTPEIRPRWKRGVAVVEESLGEVLGRIYVAEHFPPVAKARMERLVDNLLLAYEQSIKELEWMTDETKAEALKKLATFKPKIGYPDKWKDYSALEVRADDLFGNMVRSNLVESRRELAKLGAPVDPDEWHMTPQTVNAYYNPVANEIVFPAAILQPPFFNLEAEDAINYGGIGAVIGHEIGHGFDDQGSKFDGEGNLNNWWTDADRQAFDALGKQLIEQYNAYEPIPGYKVNGQLTLGENIGDLGGLSIAYEAYKLALNGRPAPVLDRYTGEQRLFIGWAQVWARKYREEALIERIKSDPHSPSEYRANGTLENIPAFHEAFNTRPGDGMWKAPEDRVQIW
ncbi:MAG: M13 family metallopeptidase [Abyssibacter sp.]|uniref:M13 family metallopeptidase n=1 Tax=Abyssibacter sp. TaxID=2320200 RepID=UPI0032197889